jgi:acetyl-CoA carboxylase beta subunit
MSTTRKPSESEDEYFARLELEKRKQWEKDRAAERSAEEKKKLKDLHFMKCPKCGHDLHSFELRGISLDRCVNCNGTWFDAGEMELLLKGDEGVLGRIKRVFG